MANPNTAVYPSVLATDSTLPVATNSFSTTLASSIGTGDTVIHGTDFSNLNVPAILQIDNETILAVTKTNSTTLSGCVRGFDSSTAASHSSGAIIDHFIADYNNNQIAAEVKAIESFLGVNGANIITSADLSGYLTISSAASTYLTQSSAASTYLTQSSAASTYLTQSSAASTYLTQTNAAATYATISALNAVAPTYTRKVIITYKTASVSGGTATIGFETGGSGAPTAAAIVGTNTLFGVAQFANSEYIQDKIFLPSDWTSTIDVEFIWRSTSTSNAVEWEFYTAGSSSGNSPNPTFNAANTVTTNCPGTTGNIVTSTITGVTLTGLTAGGLFFFKAGRAASDSLSSSGTGDLISLIITIRRLF